jgi:hypothetical protein
MDDIQSHRHALRKPGTKERMRLSVTCRIGRGMDCFPLTRRVIVDANGRDIVQADLRAAFGQHR